MICDVSIVSMDCDIVFIRAITKQSSLLLNIRGYVQYHSLKFENKETKRYGGLIAIKFILLSQQH